MTPSKSDGPNTQPTRSGTQPNGPNADVGMHEHQDDWLSGLSLIVNATGLKNKYELQARRTASSHMAPGLGDLIKANFDYKCDICKLSGHEST